MGTIWSKAIDYLVQNARVLLDAPLVFIAALLLAWGAAYWLQGLRYQGTVDQKQSTIDGLKSQIDGLKDQIASLQLKIQERPSPRAAADPDGIFQLDAQVGTVRGVQIDESQSLVFFSQIVGAIRFDTSKDFRYRGFRLHVKTLGIDSVGSINGERSRMVGQVTCEIVGRVTP
jgi:hypothetical protein